MEDEEKKQYADMLKKMLDAKKEGCGFAGVICTMDKIAGVLVGSFNKKELALISLNLKDLEKTIVKNIIQKNTISISKNMD